MSTGKWVARVVGALLVAALLGYAIGDRRGIVLGVLAFATYGLLLGVAAVQRDLRRWSADHVLLDSLATVPLAFFALLLIPPLPWWGAALIAAVAGLILVPLAIRRRRRPARLTVRQRGR